jgi:hypothetical protein
MSHFLLRVGDLLHFQLIAPALFRRHQTATLSNDARTAPSPGKAEPSTDHPTDDLASLSLSVEDDPADPRAELEKFGLLGCDGATTALGRRVEDNPWLWLP